MGLGLGLGLGPESRLVLRHLGIVTCLAGLVVLDARGDRELQPCEEGLVVVGGAGVAGAKLGGSLLNIAGEADQLEHCCRRCRHLLPCLAARP